MTKPKDAPVNGRNEALKLGALLAREAGQYEGGLVFSRLLFLEWNRIARRRGGGGGGGGGGLEEGGGAHLPSPLLESPVG
jgi:hypothetical protein